MRSGLHTRHRSDRDPRRDGYHEGKISSLCPAHMLIFIWHQQHRPPPVESVPPKRTYIISEIIPFGARLIVERIGCDLGNLEPDPEAGDHGKGKDGTKNYVRILVK